MNTQHRRNDLIRAMFALNEADRAVYESFYFESPEFKTGIDALATHFIPALLKGLWTQAQGDKRLRDELTRAAMTTTPTITQEQVENLFRTEGT